ncbi:MAG: FAD-dependent oxidoreductase [Planctomycetota bacterium]
MKTVQVDVAIIGGGLGGVAAALAALDRGCRVLLSDEFAWIGGQVTSQSLCVLDDLDFPSGERVGVTRRYAEFRARTRAYYSTHFKLSYLGRSQIHLCAGNARCSHLTAEPQVAHQCLLEWLAPALQAGRLILLPEHIPVAAERTGSSAGSSAPGGSAERVAAVTLQPVKTPGEPVRVTAGFFLDGSETGDTYPLLKAPYRLGSETAAEFNEPHGVAVADRTAIQCFTYCATVEYVPGGNFTIRKPAGYEAIRDAAQFYLSGPGATRDEPSYMFQPRILKNGARIVPFWFYRCLVDSANFEGVTARACINVKCNDFNRAAYLENPAREAVLAEARALTLAYLYWLQTEAPRDAGDGGNGGGVGYPELRPMPEASGTPDGIAMGPYVREGRRLAAHTTVTERDLSADCVATARAREFRDSVGLGGYAIDIHARAGQPGPSIWQPARPYQIPLSALVSPALENFAAAGKGIGVTQVANGAYRMHPSEWSIGEAAGELAAFCLAGKCAAPLAGQPLVQFQRRLTDAGMPLYWFEDMPFDHPGFAASQRLAAAGIWTGSAEHLRFEGEQSLGRHRKAFLAVMENLEAAGVPVTALREACLNGHNGRKYDVVHQIVALLDRSGWPV